MTEELIRRIEKCEDLNELFKLWKEAHKNDVGFCENSAALNKSAFVEDGCPFPDEYDGVVLFVAKESNSPKADENDNQRKSYVNFANGGKDWPRNLMKTKYARMYNAIINDNLPDKDAIRKIAFMNINKRGGTSKCSHAKLIKYADDYADFIRRQIEILNPKYIVCCGGCVDIAVTNVLCGGKWINTGESTPFCKNIWYYKKDGMIITHMLHPSPIKNPKYAELNSGTKDERIEKYVNEFKKRFYAINALSR